MFDPANSGNSYYDLRQHIMARLRAAKIDDQVIEIMENAAENALAAEHLVLSRPEKKRLLTEVMRSVLGDINKKLDES